MDCISCHNRITHLIYPPEESVDQLLTRGLISASIPEIRLKSVETLKSAAEARDDEQAKLLIEGMAAYYAAAHPDFYESSAELIHQTILQLEDVYADTVFREQKADWNTNPNNVGHQDSPGCFRCHDGEHLNSGKEAIRLECNLCHSIPIVAGPGDLVARIEISRGPEPESHFNANWISLHHLAFDTTCSNCHTTGDPGGTSNSTFCSNSACHGSVIEHAGFDAPLLREALADQFPPTPTPAPLPRVDESEPVTYTNTIGPMLTSRCGACHGADGVNGLNLTTYSGVMAGGATGPAIDTSDPATSLLLEIQSEETPHFGQLTEEELSVVIAWIEGGALEDNPDRQKSRINRFRCLCDQGNNLPSWVGFR
jgi:mono/diheme cytochrome c family protein